MPASKISLQFFTLEKHRFQSNYYFFTFPKVKPWGFTFVVKHTCTRCHAQVIEKLILHPPRGLGIESLHAARGGVWIHAFRRPVLYIRELHGLISPTQ